jgi:histidyl-tRNA synthetase
MEKFNLPRGTNDVLPPQVNQWRLIEETARNILATYNFREIRTPIFEETELFARSMGQTSDIVQKQMLNLVNQRPDEKVPLELSGLTLRPENTASVVRSYVQNSFDRKEALTKWFYIGPMFRGERPQKGRLRQFHQIGVEAIGPGSASPYLDAEVIALAAHLLKSVGIQDFKIKINSLGAAADKEEFSKILRGKLRGQLSLLCPECQARFERNVFRVLDCKSPDCQAVVGGLQLDYSYLSTESKAYYAEVKQALVLLGVPFEESLNLVRGLDYYTHTVFEISSAALGSQDALGAGGRYNSLVAQLGGSEGVDAVGFALGMERIILALGEGRCEARSSMDAFLIAMDGASFKEAFGLAGMLRKEGFRCDLNYKISSMKSQMRAADKSGAHFILILGEDEVKNDTVTVKDMAAGKQVIISRDEIVNYLKEKIEDEKK